MTRIIIKNASPAYIAWVKEQKADAKKRHAEIFASIDPKVTAKLLKMGKS